MNGKIFLSRKQPGFFMLDDIRNSTNITPDYRHAASHRLQQDNAESFCFTYFINNRG